MEAERLKAKRKLESKQRQFRDKQYALGIEDAYDRGDDHLMREFDRYEEDGGDFGSIF